MKGSCTAAGPPLNVSPSTVASAHGRPSLEVTAAPKSDA